MTLRPLLAATALLLSVSACTDDSNGDADTDTDGTGSSSSTTAPTTDPSTSGPGTSTSPGTTEGAESSSSGEPDDTTGNAESSSTGEPPAQDICVGYTLAGTAAQVFNDGTANGQPQCDNTPAACGGDIVGTWTGESACGYETLPNFFEDVCAGSTQQVTASNMSGTQTFNEDGSYAFDTVLQVEADLQVDSMECAMVDCETFGDALSMEPGIEMICEAGMDDQCNCFFTLDLVDQSQGTWEFFDNGLLITDDEGEVQGLYDYCVEDGRMTTWVPIYDGTPFPDTMCTLDAECEGQVEGDFDGVACEPPDDDER